MTRGLCSAGSNRSELAWFLSLATHPPALPAATGVLDTATRRFWGCWMQVGVFMAREVNKIGKLRPKESTGLARGQGAGLEV